MKRQRVSNLIGENDIAKWIDKMSDTSGCRVLINSPTGSGKSYFIGNVFADYCADKNLKILLITNRQILNRQVGVYLKDLGKNNIDVVNYQNIECRIINGKVGIFADYDVIVCDEVHYLFSDSEFNRHTDTLLSILKRAPQGKLCIFMTATPDVILSYCKKYDFYYTLKKDYSYISNLFFFKDDSQIEKTLTSGQKCLYFCGTANSAYKKSLIYKDSDFICSENNKSYYQKSSSREKTNLIKQNKFNCNILFTTKVLDNGININDKKLKNIIIDSPDPVTLIQCLGRKRVINSDDRINLYIKNYNKNYFTKKSLDYKDKIILADELENIGKREFSKKYKKKSLDSIIDNDMTVNKAKYYNYRYYQKLYYSFRDEEFGYAKYICKKLGFKFSPSMIFENSFERCVMNNFLNKNLNVKMFGKTKDNFKKELLDVLDLLGNAKFKSFSIMSLNNFIKKLGLEYYVITSVCKVNGKSERYWLIRRCDLLE